MRPGRHKVFLHARRQIDPGHEPIRQEIFTRLGQTAYVRDRTPLEKGRITTLALHDEFRRDPALPILVGDDIFIRGVRRGVEQGEHVYRCGELPFGSGDPAPGIGLDEQSVVFTMAHARNTGIWRSPSPDRRGSPPGARRSGPGRGLATTPYRVL